MFHIYNTCIAEHENILFGLKNRSQMNAKRTLNKRNIHEKRIIKDIILDGNHTFLPYQSMETAWKDCWPQSKQLCFEYNSFQLSIHLEYLQSASLLLNPFESPQRVEVEDVSQMEAISLSVERDALFEASSDYKEQNMCFCTFVYSLLIRLHYILFIKQLTGLFIKTHTIRCRQQVIVVTLALFYSLCI